MADDNTYMDASVKDVYNPQVYYRLDIQIIKGIKLFAADMGGTSDPYVKAICLNRQFKTKTIEKTLEPEWNACTRLNFMQKPPNILFKCVDWNRLKNKDIGYYDLEIPDEFWEPKNPGFVRQGVQLKMDNSTADYGKIVIEVRCNKWNIGEMVKKEAKLLQQKRDVIDKTKTCNQQINNYNNSCDTMTNNQVNYNKSLDGIKLQCNQAKDDITNLKIEFEKKKAAKSQYKKEFKECDKQYRKLKKECQKIDRALCNYKEISPEEFNLTVQIENHIDRLSKYETNNPDKSNKVLMSRSTTTTGGDGDDSDNDDVKDDVKDDDKDDDDDDDDFDEFKERQICSEFVRLYCEKKEKADECQNELKNDNSDELNQEWQKCDTKMKVYLREINDWRGNILDIYGDICTSTCDTYLTSSAWNQKQCDLFSGLYINLCKFFFNIQFINSTFKQNKDLIEELTGKSSSRYITLKDLTDIWKKLYSKNDLDWIVDDLNTFLKDDLVIWGCCKKILKFMKDFSDNNYCSFSKDLCVKIISKISTTGIVVNGYINDLSSSVINVMNEKDFCGDIVTILSTKDEYSEYFDDILSFVVINYPTDAYFAAPDDKKQQKELNKKLKKCKKMIDNLKKIKMKKGKITKKTKAKDVCVFDKESKKAIKKRIDEFYADVGREGNTCCNFDDCCQNSCTGISGWFSNLFGGNTTSTTTSTKTTTTNNNDVTDDDADDKDDTTDDT